VTTVKVYAQHRYCINKLCKSQRYLVKKITVPYGGVVHCLGPEGNGVSSGVGGKGGPGPPDEGGDNQSNLSMEGGNMEQEEEGKKSHA
jgi:hypothetical protein